jgi:hypothetical protein
MKILENTRNLLAIIDREVDGMEFEASDRNRVSGALFDIAHDHAKAIVVLLENKIYASVYALARPLFESFVRAAWVQHCASDDEIAHLIKKDEVKLTFGQMLGAVEKNRQWEETLTQVKRRMWKSMHSYTHGGLQLISRRFKDKFLEPNFDELEIMGLLQLVAIISFLSFTEIVGMSGTANEKDKVLNQLYDSMCSWCFNQSVNQTAGISVV